ncbi:hypothetical protein DFH27DRAFT_338172 [Peziza echinospora]|nr:hypothetical protein DFH27DRAFT_338172 [Peziza echinospora]
MEAGPAIPPHILAKRKRKAEEAAAAAKSTPIGPTMPQEPESTTPEKRPRIQGPAPPPAPLDERPDNDPETSDDSDGEIGPALPSGLSREAEERAAEIRLAKFAESKPVKAVDDGKPKRDEWMLVPPKDSDFTARVDPTKIKNRKFQTGKGAKAPQKASGDTTLWTETPMEKQKRVQDEIMGVRKPATQMSAEDTDKKRKTAKTEAEAEETARRIKDYNEKHRSSTLYQQHSTNAAKKNEDDDPSKRAWDREKDFALSRKVTNSQKKELLGRAAQFGDRFSSGSFL